MRLPGALALVVVTAACSGETSSQQEAAQTSAPRGDPTSAGEPPGAPPAERAEETGFVDTCSLPASTCTAAPPGFGEGSGLTAVDRCAFALEERVDRAPSPVVTALEGITTRVSVGEVLADANRVATRTTTVPGSPAGVDYAFRWQDDDNDSVAWTPQGISGTADAEASGKVGEKSAVLVSFYDDPPAGSGDANRGVRIAFVDTSNPDAPRYRFALLVMPKGPASAPSFEPARIHAGGIVWYGPYLYVADTAHGFRVFDMRRILRVATSADPAFFGCTPTSCSAASYKYVIPQVGNYEVRSACKPIFSYVSLDRSTDPPALVSGEYCSTDACSGPLAGRVYRWPLDKATGLLRSKLTFPTEVLLTSHKQVQGGASIDGAYYFSSSAPAAAGGALYRVVGARSATSNWSDSPEDLMVDNGNGWLWSLSEAPTARAVFAVRISSYPRP